MTGEALTVECDADRHDQCRDDQVGYQGAHVACTCKCHKPHDHAERCCREHRTHSMPHRGCILR